MGQIAILQIQVVEGEGAVHPQGARCPRPVTVLVTDESGRTVAGAAVSFHLPEGGPGGIFVNTLRTDVALTDARGRATVRAFHANHTPGQFQMRIIAAKEQARAGTVSLQYIGEARSSAAGHRKWIAIAAVAGGGALAGVLASHGSPPPQSVPALPPPPVLTIGLPGISVGKP